jgi:hypothetical protein
MASYGNKKHDYLNIFNSDSNLVDHSVSGPIKVTDDWKKISTVCPLVRSEEFTAQTLYDQRNFIGKG